MSSKESREALLSLVRVGVGAKDGPLPAVVDWKEVEALANEQGLLAIMLDGLGEWPPASYRMPDLLKKQWIGVALLYESNYDTQQKAANEMALLFSRNAIRTYVLKGNVISECYPNPKHRVSADMDCFLLPSQGCIDAWELGNQLMENFGFKVSRGFYKNSSFHLPGLTVENHRYMVPFRGNKRLMAVEKVLQNYLRNDKGEDCFDGTYLCRPPVMMSALFLIEHAYSHFLHEGLTWRHVLDWMMFSAKHEREIDWAVLGAQIDEFGFRRFYDSYYRLGQYLLGDLKENSLTKVDRRMLEDIWAPLDLHETLHGVKGKLALAGNTWRARWKYHYFSDISMLHALWIQTKGVLFEKNAKLD